MNVIIQIDTLPTLLHLESVLSWGPQQLWGRPCPLQCTEGVGVEDTSSGALFPYMGGHSPGRQLSGPGTQVFVL